MFTGIISDTTKILGSKRSTDNLRITFKKPADWTDLKLGESIATNGVCLTVAAIRDNEYDCDLMTETLTVTSFGGSLPKVVNLERALRAGDRFDGHFVQGHVDCVGQVTKVDKVGGWRLSVQFDPRYKKLVAPKGSITIDGVSLTVAALKGTTATVALVPYTLAHTTLVKLKAGDKVNLEFDMIAKYVNRITEEK